ncbi:MAG TPA: hypothetical protein VF476_05390 [Chitinophagaceae bacterium]
MNSAMSNDLVKIVLQKNSLQDCSVDELKRLTEKYPYFSAGQLLLAQKLKTENQSAYNEQLQKLSLYLHDPLWMEQLLEPKGELNVRAAQPISQIETGMEAEPEPQPEPIPIPEPVAIEETKIEEPVVEQTIEIAESKTEPVNTDNKNELTFEPYHTVDYFASQGIRFREEEQPKDKFGLQLKSFTEWLKTLKRLPVAEMVVTVDRNSEKKVDQMAETSLDDREVVTETMAEVWEKQGNHEKAIETYHKLSLLNPSKSSYFAAKIEHLKTS